MAYTIDDVVSVENDLISPFDHKIVRLWDIDGNSTIISRGLEPTEAVALQRTIFAHIGSWLLAEHEAHAGTSALLDRVRETHERNEAEREGLIKRAFDGLLQ